MKNKIVKYATIVMVSIISIVAISTFTVVLAKYIRTRDYTINFESGKFYFTVDLLGDTNDIESLTGEYDLYGGDEKEIIFNVQNFFDELRINKDNIKYNISYEITNPAGKSYDLAQLKNSDGNVITTEERTLIGDTKSFNKYTLTLPEGYANGTVVTVTISSVTPYTKTMKLVFNLHNYEHLIGYYVNDSSGDIAILAELFITFNLNVDVSVNEIIIDWSSINATSNVIQLDESNPDVTPIDDGGEYYSKAKINRDVTAGESITIYFFKTDTTKNYSFEIKSAQLVDGNYYITIE